MEGYRRKPVPPPAGLIAVVGPGIVWMALAQGSGELIWWPYMVARYGLAFVFLLIPACLLQYPLTYSIGYYTLATGESVFQGFIRLNRYFGIFLWVLMTLSFLWFGAFATAGGTAMAELTDLPHGWSRRGQTLFWAYLSIGVFFTAIVLSRVVYTLIERFMKAVAIVTVTGLLWACATQEVLTALPEFLKGLFTPTLTLPENWNRADATKLLTAITFAGLGGFWTLLYSYWIRDKGMGMAQHVGRITGPITGRPEVIPDTGFVPEDGEQNRRHFSLWRRYLLVDSGTGIVGNIVTTLMTCLLAYALLHPQGLVPEGYQIAVVQSRFFEISWGWLGTVIFLVVAASFLSDTWLATVDGVSRMQADIVHTLFPRLKRYDVRTLYYIFLFALTLITSVTMVFTAPGPLILLSAVIGFAGTVIFTGALIVLNHWYLPRHLPCWATPSKGLLALMLVAFVAYLGLAVAYLYIRLF